MNTMTPEPLQATFRPTGFNFVDLESKAEAYLAHVKAQTERITQEARAEVLKVREEIRKEQEETSALSLKMQNESAAFQKRLAEENAVLDEKRRNAEQQGYEKGFAEGRDAGFQEGRSQGYADGELQAKLDHDLQVKQEVQIFLGDKLETLIPAIKSSVEQIQTAQQSFLRLWEQSAIHVAGAIAERAISRQLPEMVDVPLRLLREALELAVGCSQMRIRLNPDDYETLKPQMDSLIEELSGAAETEIISDVRISPGGCLLETSLGTIDQRIGSRLDRIKMELV
ncbi:MAG: FliH/SctL family protein [Thermoguttaceae bacterium]